VRPVYDALRASSRARLLRVFVVLAGIVVGQAVLYGPSLCGTKVLLPLDLLAYRGCYTPQSDGLRERRPKNSSVSDLIFLCEPARRFAVSEFRAGRLPMWTPF